MLDTDVAGDSLRQGARPGLGGGSSHMRKRGLPPKLVGGVTAARSRPAGRRLRKLVRCGWRVCNQFIYPAACRPYWIIATASFQQLPSVPA